jgi:microcystin-dependent protein
MGQPYVGEIKLFGGNFAPAGWKLCQGQLLPISEYETLFNLIGTTYGGDGQSTFALPNLQSRVPVHSGSNGQNSYVLGQEGGAENVTLTNQQLPSHSHGLPVTDSAATQAAPAGAIPAAWSATQYSDVAQNGSMGQAVQASGGGQPHDNMVPFLAVNFIISLFGVFPSQN